MAIKGTNNYPVSSIIVSSPSLTTILCLYTTVTLYIFKMVSGKLITILVAAFTVVGVSVHPLLDVNFKC